MGNCRVHGLVRHRDHALCHTETDEIDDRKPRPRMRIEAGEKVFDRRRGGESDVAPDGKQDEQASRIPLRGIDARDYFLVGCETGEAALDFTRGHMRLQLREKAFLNLRFCLAALSLSIFSL